MSDLAQLALIFVFLAAIGIGGKIAIIHGVDSGVVETTGWALILGVSYFTLLKEIRKGRR